MPWAAPFHLINSGQNGVSDQQEEEGPSREKLQLPACFCIIMLLEGASARQLWIRIYKLGIWYI